jgi:hypothetical protein
VVKIGQILSAMDAEAWLNPKFDRLSISLDDNPNRIPPVSDSHITCKDDLHLGIMEYNPAAYGDQGLLTICHQNLEQLYSLHDIENPPHWALDGHGIPEDGFGCDKLMGRDTQYMESPGAVLFHELLHW